MINKIKHFFSNWTLFEILLSTFSPIVILTVGLIFKTDALTITTAIVGIMCAFLTAKGLVIGQFFGIAIVVLYSLVSYKNGFYGEMIIYIFIMFPMYVWGIFSWLKHKNEQTKTVDINSIKPKEWLYVSICSIIIFIGFYFLLRALNTNELIISTLSVVDNIFALYLVARRSKYNFISYIFNDLILIILWGIPILSGNLYLLAFLLNPIVNLINDVYGFVHWTKLQKIQNNCV